MIASKLSRLHARIFDSLVIFLLQLISNLLFVIKTENVVIMFIIVTLHNLILLAVILYFFFADSLPNGQSFGKKIFGIAVVSTNSDKSCSISRSFIRNMIFAIPVGGLVELIAINSDEQGRRIGDKFARTLVIKRDTRR